MCVVLLGTRLLSLDRCDRPGENASLETVRGRFTGDGASILRGRLEGTRVSRLPGDSMSCDLPRSRVARNDLRSSNVSHNGTLPYRPPAYERPACSLALTSTVPERDVQLRLELT